MVLLLIPGAKKEKRYIQTFNFNQNGIWSEGFSSPLKLDSYLSSLTFEVSLVKLKNDQLKSRHFFPNRLFDSPKMKNLTRFKNILDKLIKPKEQSSLNLVLTFIFPKASFSHS